MFGKLHNLVNKFRKARYAGNHSLAESAWLEAQEEINMLPDYEPSVRERFSNLLYDDLEDLHAESLGIDLDSLMEFTQRNPEAGKRRRPPPPPLPY